MSRFVRQSLLLAVAFGLASASAFSAEERREASPPGPMSAAAADPAKEAASAPGQKSSEKPADSVKRQELTKKYGAQVADAILAGKVLKGMTSEQVRLARGEPVSKEVVPPDAELWRYPEGEVAFSGGKVTYVELKERRPAPTAPLTEKPTDTASNKRSPSLSVSAPEIVSLKGGCFLMGSPESESGRNSNERQHQVCVQPFRIGKYEVTQGEWQAVMGNNPSSFSSCGDRCPVEQVSLNDVHVFLEQLNARTGKQFRLPTEAEWEYACRGGRDNDHYCGGNNATAVAWYEDNSGGQTHPVGRKDVNAFGLSDMSGNVREWTCSSYDKDYDSADTRCAGKYDANSQRSVRGGSWDNRPAWVRAAYRFGITPDFRYRTLGFRLVQD